MGLLELWVMFMVLGFFTQVKILNSQNLTCDSGDLRALVGFMNGLESGIDGWITNPSSSSSSNCCSWAGITCNSSSALGFNRTVSNSGRVVKLELPNMKLNGNLSDSLVGLDQLRTLNLSRNSLSSPLPLSLLNFLNLEVLDLSNNQLFGGFPSSINLPAVQVFDVSENALNGSVPAGVCVNSTRIEMLKFGENSFSGSIPSDFENCTSLQQLCLASNSLSGTLPEYLFTLPNLVRLNLQYNLLSGQISAGVNGVSKLNYLDISMNRFSGSVPDFFASFPELFYFSCHSNNFSGGIPSSLSNSPTVSSLSLRNNSLEGPISLNCSAMINLTSLDLGSNYFYGLMPDNLPLCPNLRSINLAKNKIGGPVPETFETFHSLSSLSLSNCSFTNLASALQILQHCRNLSTLVLTMNYRGEELPSFPALRFDALRVLVIANCRLTGAIPPWLSGLTELQFLDLSWNSLMGTIPPFMGSFPFLFYLDLSNNSLSGEIPRNLTGLPALIWKNISFEEPSPDFPFFLKRNSSIRGLQYNQILNFPPTIELSNNFLTGPIWPEFGNLRRLQVLDLKCNNLSGTIPESLSGMMSIEALDLSFNDFSGTIPVSLESLNFLSKFNVAYNNLSGEIPSRGQFTTFPNSSFEGNPYLLCMSSPRSSCHTSGIVPAGSPRNLRKKKGFIIGMAIGIGFGSTFLLSLMCLIAMRAKNHHKEIDPVLEEEFYEQGHDESGSKFVVLFGNRDHLCNSKELSIKELLASTNGFDQSNIIGCGGFGLVYKAVLPDGKKVAVKRLSGNGGQMEREFQAEVETLSKALHPNLVHLQGFCTYKTDKILIYAYMENGSLDYWLHEKTDGPALLDWPKRLRIAQGAARGLFYLHQECDPHILHRDVKSSNILLDENFEAHLADFGLARLILPYNTHVTTDLVGTLGYIPPEYGQASVATYKGDVYSFGVVLLELLTGKRPLDVCRPKGRRDVISWVVQMRGEGREGEVFDPFIYDKENAKELARVLEVACLCLKESPKARPSAQEIVSWLDAVGLGEY